MLRIRGKRKKGFGFDYRVEGVFVRRRGYDLRGGSRGEGGREEDGKVGS